MMYLMENHKPQTLPQQYLDAVDLQMAGDIKRLVASGVPVDHTQSPPDLTPFQYCAKKGRIRMCLLLASLGADIHTIKNGGNALVHCYQSRPEGFEDKIISLIDMGINPASIYPMAVENNNIPLVKEILSRGVPVDFMPPKRLSTTFQRAASLGNIEMCELLHSHGANVNASANGGNALALTLKSSAKISIQKLSYFLNMGVSEKQPDEKGVTPEKLASKMHDVSNLFKSHQAKQMMQAIMTEEKNSAPAPSFRD
jgi:ankyrin repeat protein